MNEDILNQDIQDPSEIGVEGLTGINTIQEDETEFQNKEYTKKVIGIPRGRESSFYRDLFGVEEGLVTPVQLPEDFGKSKYDYNITSASDLYNLNNIRAQNQGAFVKLMNGLGKAAVTAGTSFVDAAGILFGIEEAIRNRKWSKLWDNEIMDFTSKLEKWSEEAMTNYKTESQQAQPWYAPDNLFSANFLADNVIKNFGFMAGTLGAGALAGKAVGSLGHIVKLGNTIAPSTAKGIQAFAGSLISAYGESSMEAYNNSKAAFEATNKAVDKKREDRIKALDNQYAPLFETLNKEYEAINNLPDKKLRIRISNEEPISEYEYRLHRYNTNINNILNEYYKKRQEIEDDHTKELQKAKENEIKTGNKIFIEQWPMLAAADLWAFGKILGRAPLRTVKMHLTKAKGYAGVIGMNAYQGIEELNQKIISSIAADYYLKDFNAFVEAKYDQDYKKKASNPPNWWDSMKEGTVNTLEDPESWEEAFTAFISTPFGVPSLRGVRSSSGKLQSPIYFQGTILERFRDVNNKIDRANKIKEYIQGRINTDPKFRAYYQGLTRHFNLNKDLIEAAQKEDEFEFKNTEFAQLISDVIMFDSARKLGDLEDMIDATLSTDDNNLKFIVENATNVDENGNLQGPYAQWATVTKDNEGNNVVTANISDNSKQDLIDEVNKNKDKLHKALKDYKKAKNKTDRHTDIRLSDDQLEEITWYDLKLGNWKERSAQISKEIKDILKRTKDTLENNIKASTDETSRATNQNLLDQLNPLLEYEDEFFGKNIIKNNEIDAVKDFAKEGVKESEDDTESSIEKKIDDLVKIEKGIEAYTNKLDEYLRNPVKQQEDHNKAHKKRESRKERKQREQSEAKIKNIKDALKNTTDLTGFRTVADDPELDADEKNNAINELVNEGHSLASTYRNLLKQRQNARAYLNNKQKNSELDNRTYKDANQLLDYFYDSAKDEEGLSSGIITDEINDSEESIKNTENILEPLSDSEKKTINPKDRALNAREALLKALSYKSSTNNMDNPAPATNESEGTRTQEGNQPEGEQGNKDNKGQGNQQDTTKKPTEEGENEDQEQKPEDVPEIIEPETDDNVNNENRDSEDNEANRGPINKSNEIISSIPKYSVEERRDHRVLIPLKDADSSFTNIWDYLNDHGAFDYIDDGNLKAGDKVSFMIDPAFEASKGWDSITIFIVKGDQVIGVLHENPKKVAEYQGLKELRESIEAEYKNHKGDGKFKSKITTTVNRILNGYVPMGNQQNLNSGFFGEEEPVFAVMKNGRLVTNKSGIKVQQLQNSVGKEGRVYLLIKGANGVYVPYGVRRVTTKDMDLRDTKEGTIQDDIRKALDTLAKYLFKNAEAFKKGATFTGENSALKDLAKALVLGDFHFQIVENNGNKALLISKKLRDENGRLIRDENGTKEQHVYIKLGTEQTTEVDGVIPPIGGIGVKSNFISLAENEILTNLITAIKKLEMLPQISASSINKDSYNDKIINSEVLNSNISNPKQSGAWFSLNSKQDISSTRETPKKPVNNNSTKTVELPAGFQYTIEESNGEFTVKNSNNEPVTDSNLGSIIVGLLYNPNNYLTNDAHRLFIYDRAKERFFTIVSEKDYATEVKDLDLINSLREDFGLNSSPESSSTSGDTDIPIIDNTDIDFERSISSADEYGITPEEYENYERERTEREKKRKEENEEIERVYNSLRSTVSSKGYSLITGRDASLKHLSYFDRLVARSPKFLGWFNNLKAKIVQDRIAMIESDYKDGSIVDVSNRRDAASVLAELPGRYGKVAIALIDRFGDALKDIAITTDYMPVGTNAYYRRSDNTIHINANYEGEDINRTILHEVIHALTSKEFENNKDFRRAIHELNEYLKIYIRDPEWTNPTFSVLYRYLQLTEGSGKELITYALTDSTFAMALKQVPYRVDRSKAKTVWESFTDAIRNLFGFYKGDTLFDAILETTSQYMNFTYTGFENYEDLTYLTSEGAPTQAAIDYFKSHFSMKEWLNHVNENDINRADFSPIDSKRNDLNKRATWRNREPNISESPRQVSDWNSQSDEDRWYLEQAGWLEEEFNKLTSDEKEQALNCAGIG